jgi:hypothetical protein
MISQLLIHFIEHLCFLLHFIPFYVFISNQVPWSKGLSNKSLHCEFKFEFPCEFQCLSPVKLKSESHYDLRSVSKAVYRGFDPTLGLVIRNCFLSESWCVNVAVLFCGAPSLTKSSYFTTDAESDSMSSCRAHSGTSCRKVAVRKLRSAVCIAITEWSKSRRTRNHTLVSHLRLPQPGGPDSRIYIPQKQGGPVLPQDSRFRLRCLLQLAGLRWRRGLSKNKSSLTLS